MSEKSCPVNDTLLQLGNMIEAGWFKHPKNRRIAEEILELLTDIAWGRAGEAHIPSIRSLARELGGVVPDQSSADAATIVEDALKRHNEVFHSHVTTRHCPTGDCVKLPPVPCQMACPAGIDIPTYVTLIGMGKDAEAIEVIRKDNPFPWVCGLVCTKPCELMCVRGRIDSPVSIKALKAFAAERAMSTMQYRNPKKGPDKNKNVCVIGAGPGGMSAAYYLALKGYRVRVIEAQPVAGGMMMLGIPRYRLPREVIDREVAMIQDLGVEFRFNTRFGTDIRLDDLKKEGFEAFFFAIGAQKSFKLEIPGENDYPQVIEAVDLLGKVALGERKLPGKRVIVIGGGNVAIDAARTCLRLGCEEVILAYRRSREEMPADHEEVEQAEEEGIKFSFLTVPVEIVGKNGKVVSLHCLRAELVSREGSNRKSPVPVVGSDFHLEADAIVSAIGQRVDHACLADLSGIMWTRRNTLDAHKATTETHMEGIFAAGDAVTGPATVIEAIGGGKRAAEAIDRYLSGIPQPKMPPVPVRRGRLACFPTAASAKMLSKRPGMPLLNVDRRRTTFQQVELGYGESAVREEARRCLRCDICRRCGQCVAICKDRMGIDALKLGYLDFDHPGPTDFRHTEQTCIVCGACAANCPNEAIKMEETGGERILSLCGTVLSRQRLATCDSCGAVIGPARYLDYVRKRTSSVGLKAGHLNLCDACGRKKTARHSSKLPWE